MEETLKLILDKLNSMDSDIKDLKQGQNRLEQGQKNLEQGQKSLEQRQISLEQGQKNLEQGQKGLEQGQKSLEQRQTSLEQRQTSLEQGQLNLADKLDSFEKQTMKRFNEIDNKISSVSDAVADLMEFRTETESKLKKIK